MERVRVADLKAKLSEYLREASAGETVVVMNRSQPVAMLGPYRASAGGPGARPPRQGAPAPGSIALPPPLLGLGLDVVDLLLEDRRGQ
jgi:prevent-host-death family protein